jgi:katanin p60 ATPase-containing subunit A1
MPIDLGGPFFDMYQKALARAKAQQEKGNLAEAAAAYRQTAGFLASYADYASDPKTKAQWKERSSAYRDLADRMARGKFAVAATEEVPRSAEQYEDEIAALIHRSQVSWTDIGGLEETKREIKTAYGLSMARPPEGIKLRGWRSLLFYGPPGTGKTLLAAAASHGLDAAFFNVKVSNLLSKYFGESSKLITALYATARRMAPAVVFLDELESLTAQRDGSGSGAEMRIVSTFLAELDGLAGKDDTSYIMTIGATNVPWLIDKAILSRFERKIYVPLPDAAAREGILRIHLEKRGYQTALPYAELAQRSAGYSGRELEQLTAEAVKGMVQAVNPGLLDLVDQGRQAVEKYQLSVRPLDAADFDAAFAAIKPATSPAGLIRYADWASGNE